jgi:hypothetical protein
MPIKVKTEFAGIIIGFRNSSLPLGQRSESDLNFLFQRAKSRNNQRWLNFFETEDLPTQKEIDAVKEKLFTEKISRKNSKKQN